MSLLEADTNKFDPKYAYELIFGKREPFFSDELKLAVFGLFVWTCAYSYGETSPSASGSKRLNGRLSVEDALYTLSMRILMKKLGRKCRPQNLNEDKSVTPTFDYIIKRMERKSNKDLYENIIARLGGFYKIKRSKRLSCLRLMIEELSLKSKTHFDILKYIILECENPDKRYVENPQSGIRDRIKTALAENVFDRTENYYRRPRDKKAKANRPEKALKRTTSFFDKAIDKVDKKALLAFCVLSSRRLTFLNVAAVPQSNIDADGLYPSDKSEFILHETKHMIEGGGLFESLYEGLNRYGYYLELIKKTEIEGKLLQKIEILTNVQYLEKLEPITDSDYHNFIAFPEKMETKMTHKFENTNSPS